MATKYENLKDTLLAWSNRDKEIFGTTVAKQDTLLASFLSYSADECYRRLRIPPLETDREYTIESGDIYGDGYFSYNKIAIPVDFVELYSIRIISNINTAENPVISERQDEKTFFDKTTSRFSDHAFMRVGDHLYIKPALPADTVVNLHYYRVLPSLQASYSVIPSNIVWSNSTPPAPNAAQPFLSVSTTGTTLYSVTVTKGSATNPVAYYSTAAERDTAHDSYTPPTDYTKGKGFTVFTGNEVGNWLRDQNEKCLLWGALAKMYQFLSDAEQEQRFTQLFDMEIERLNQEESRRRVKGGYMQVSVSSNLI